MGPVDPGSRPLWRRDRRRLNSDDAADKAEAGGRAPNHGVPRSTIPAAPNEDDYSDEETMAIRPNLHTDWSGIVRGKAA